MIINAASASFSNVFAQRSRTLLFKTLGATLLFLILIWFGFQGAISEYLLPYMTNLSPELPGWLSWLSFLSSIFVIFAAIGSALALALLISPISALVAGFFIDEIADDIEQRYFPNDPPGKAMPLGQSISHSIRFLFVILIGNMVALLLLLVPGINLVAFFLVNGYLLGREYFEFATLRHHPREQARKIRSRYSSQVFLAGLVIAGFLSVPLLNLLTPFFAAGMMVFLHKSLMARESGTYR